ncbi:MAG: exodeoxyribonuclease VII large subunit [Spirochaetaceae bacterium]|nr:MAG: exodeoxyribonuclease VII large subunit [Spirochaetaceae bacterium]
MKAANDQPEHAYSVTQITSLIRDLLEGEFFGITVEGEISNFRPSSTGHLYFSLKDEQSVLSAVMFKNRLFGLSFKPADGMVVRATGNISVYAKRGTYQLICESLQKAGEGELLALLEKRKAELASEGLFDRERKQPLPLFPARVAVVTSPTGAAIRDILRVLKRRNAGLNLVILPSPVQGEGAAETIAGQIRRANEFEMGDVLIVTRGGGSLEDLLPFYEEVVVRAIAESRIPVISAVGHEIDTTLTDLVADVRAPTPSAAAEMVSASRLELSDRLAAIRNGISEALQSRVERIRLLLSQFTPDNLIRNFQIYVQPYALQVEETRDELKLSTERLLVPARHRLDLLSQAIRSNSPLAVLQRGYAVVSSEKTGQVLLSSREINTAETVNIRLHRGRLRAEVKEKEE